jgi:alginate O-acetyltransferase complex protein AlgI
MLFNSFPFLIFLVITFIIYYLPLNLIKKNQVVILVLASFFFYAFQKPVLLLLLISSIIINTYFSFSIHNVEKRKVKRFLLLGVIFNISILAFFKYSTLIASTLNKEFSLNNGFVDLLLTIPLPIGISFYTFEGISLLLDLYKGKTVIDMESNSFLVHLKRTAFFISFFPHLIAGPILKARDFYPQIDHKSFKAIQWEYAVKKLILGFFLKMVIADNLNDITKNIAFPFFQGYSSGNLVLLLFGYSMQIFSDFAGYSLIAIGLGSLFGYNLPKNFDFPYISSSFSEFWRRWHISLSTWLRDYLYIPLGGNKKGELRTYFNLFIVMFLGGLWHGASWTYAVWGSMHGFCLMVERKFRKEKPNDESRNPLAVFFVFFIVTILWLLFKLTSFSYFLLYFKAIWENIHLPFKFGLDQLSILFYSSAIILYHLIYLINQSANITRNSFKLEVALYTTMLFFIVVSSGPQGSFIYFQF